MQIYNTLTKKKEEFLPLDPPNVTMYVCGPTVYDFFHIGNARTFIMSDMIRRYLIYKGFKVRFAMNITDVDDKIIRKANEEKISASEFSKKYAGEFLHDIESLKIKKADIYPYATEHIEEMIELIKDLEQKGVAYNIDGNVFYDVRKFSSYGKLSGKNIDDLESGARVEINESKKNPLDFSLWKKAKEGEPSWESPWGQGRPGWHIECSAMAMKHLGKSIDIHAGGSDLIFPHHENEIAQSEASTNCQFAKYWIHFGFLNIDNEKMSKSLGNFFTARDVLKKYSAETIRFFFAQTIYSGPLNFSDELLAAAEKGLEKLNNLVLHSLDYLKNLSSDAERSEFDFHKYYSDFEKAVDDDFNTPKGLAVIFEFIKDANKYIADHNSDKEFYTGIIEFLKKTAQDVLGILHIENLSQGKESDIEDALINLFLELRIRLKQEKQYQLADEVRDKLSKLGIQIQDSKTGSTYKKS
ncbi:MAG: cysteine--tRNA ligase [Melioribacteraceae bacterium]|nr:cysteine--tRNA ligase [Melioribacteraceae bacterium]